MTVADLIVAVLETDLVVVGLIFVVVVPVLILRSILRR